MNERPMSTTQATWTPASEPPAVEPGLTMPVIVARRSDKGTWHVFGAAYLNAVEIDPDGLGDDDEPTMTGFVVDKRDDYYDEFYEAIDVEYWAPMPEPPEA